MPDRTDPLSLTTVEFTLCPACGWALQTLIALSALNIKLNTDNIVRFVWVLQQNYCKKEWFNFFSNATGIWSVCLQIFVNIIIFLFNPPVSRLHSDLWYCSKLLHARPPPPPACLLTIIQDRSSHCYTLWSENFTNVMIIICLSSWPKGLAPLVLISAGHPQAIFVPVL